MTVSLNINMNPKTGREFDYSQDDGPKLFTQEEFPTLNFNPVVSFDKISIVGMTFSFAKEFLQQKGYCIRVAIEDGEHYLLTMDYNPKRIDVEVKNGVIVGLA